MNKKVLSRVLTAIFLAVVLIAAGVFFVSPAKQDNALAATDTWKTKYTSTSETLETDADGYYIINSANDFATFCYEKLANNNQFGRLYANISLTLYNWEPVILTQYSILDGNNYTISYLKIDGTVYSQAGLFSKIDYNAQVKNLRIPNSTITQPKQYAGFIAGYCEGVNTNTAQT